MLINKRGLNAASRRLAAPCRFGPTVSQETARLVASSDTSKSMIIATLLLASLSLIRVGSYMPKCNAKFIRYGLPERTGLFKALEGAMLSRLRLFITEVWSIRKGYQCLYGPCTGRSIFMYTSRLSFSTPKQKPSARLSWGSLPSCSNNLTCPQSMDSEHSL